MGRTQMHDADMRVWGIVLVGATGLRKAPTAAPTPGAMHAPCVCARVQRRYWGDLV